jgi:hypothetical protein
VIQHIDSDQDGNSDGPGCLILILVMISLLLGLLLLFFIAGCQGTATPALPTGPGWKTIASGDGTYQVLLHLPDPAPLNQEFTASGRVLKGGEPISDDAVVHFDGGMPQHAHGLAVPVVTTRRPDGGFEAQGVRFHMGGRWLLTVDVEEGPHLERARTWVEIR